MQVDINIDTVSRFRVELQVNFTRDLLFLQTLPKFLK